MDVIKKKRDQKVRDKKNDGTVSFSYTEKKSNREKAKSKDKKVGEKRPFKDKKSSASPYQNRDGAKKREETDAEKTHSQKRREKQKVSDLIKKLRINYNKLQMKKKELKITDENKYQIVAECMEIIKDKFESLIFKHDGCRILQALIKHGSKEHKNTIIENIKGHIVQLMT